MMEVECGRCNITERGRYGRLLEGGWVIIHLYKSIKIMRCPACKPLMWERRGNFKEFKVEDIKKETLRKVDRIRIIRNLNKS